MLQASGLVSHTCTHYGPIFLFAFCTVIFWWLWTTCNNWLWPGLFKPTRDFSSDLTAMLSSWALPTMHLTICFTCTAIVRILSGMLCSTQSNEGFFLARTCSFATCSYRYFSTLGIILGIIMCLMERDILMEASIWWSFSFFLLMLRKLQESFCSWWPEDRKRLLPG